mmetsp:Transcript_27515/g.75146  ORF Transcript_27515/g.75146 Transcript_27515/m.75146 type:complete len:207 (+) Transcript_27515:1267-1887(+)
MPLVEGVGGGDVVGLELFGREAGAVRRLACRGARRHFARYLLPSIDGRLSARDGGWLGSLRSDELGCLLVARLLVAKDDFRRVDSIDWEAKELLPVNSGGLEGGCGIVIGEALGRKPALALKLLLELGNAGRHRCHKRGHVLDLRKELGGSRAELIVAREPLGEWLELANGFDLQAESVGGATRLAEERADLVLGGAELGAHALGR